MGVCGCCGISWTICKWSASRSRQITTPTPHHSIFTGRMPFLMLFQTTVSKHWKNWTRTIHTHLFNDPLSDTTRWASTRKVKPIWILLKQETVGGSGISWAICKSAPCSRQITTPAPHYSVFTGRMPFLLPNQQRQSTEGRVTRTIHRHYKRMYSMTWTETFSGRFRQ